MSDGWASETLPPSFEKLYMVITLAGVKHSLKYAVGYSEARTMCGLPATSSEEMMMEVYTNSVDFTEDEHFCEMCYDALALRALANI